MKYVIKNVTDIHELNAVIRFSQDIFGNLERMNTHPELMLYAESGGNVISVVLAFLEDNGNITIGIVATDEKHRKRGIAKEMMLMIEERAKALDVHLLALGSAETAEDFYTKLGYTGQLLIQSEKHTIDELLSLNPGHCVVFTNVYDGKINQICLKITQPDCKLQQLYETTFDQCYTQTMFWKAI